MASIFKKPKTASSLNIDFQKELASRLTKGTMKDRQWSMESFIASVDQHGDSSPEYNEARAVVENVIRATMGDEAYENLTDGQRDAAVLALVSAQDGRRQLEVPRASIESFKVTPTELTNDGVLVTSFGIPTSEQGNYDYQLVRRSFSNEVFDDRNLDNYIKTTVGFHILAARQTPAAEALYPTYAIAPDQTGYTIEVERPLVFNQIWHDSDGSSVDFNSKRKLLLLAYQDYTILKNTATLIKPYYDETDDVNKSFYVADTIVEPEVYDPATPEDNFKTSWFAPDKTFSLIGLGQNPTLAKLGKANTTDTLDHRVVLDRILVELKTDDGTSYIPVETKHLAYSQFNPSFEGQQTKVVLTFTTRDLVLSKDTKDVKGQTPAALTTLVNNYPDYRIIYALDVNGRITLESSETRIQKATGEVVDVLKVTGTGVNAVVEKADAATADTIKKLVKEVNFIGYKLEAYLTNFNRAIHGPLVTQERYRDSHMIPLGAPITAQVPVVDVANATVDVTTPAQTLMIRNSNNAFTTLFNFERVLEIVQDAFHNTNAAIPQIRAIGRWILARPWYAKETYLVSDEINSLTTADRNDNISAGICNKLRMMVNTGYYHTNFQAAMDVLGISAGQRPRLVLICNPIVANYIFTKGDSRTLGDGWEFDIIADADKRFIDRDEHGNPIYRIYAVFKVPGVDGPHPLNFGNMIYKPDIATQLPITRDNRTTVEFTVQPWTLHVNHCPVLFRLDVAGLEEATTTSMPVQTTIV